MEFGDRQTRVPIIVLLSPAMIFDILSKISYSEFPSLYQGVCNSPYFRGLLWELNKMIHEKYFLYWLAHSNYSMNGISCFWHCCYYFCYYWLLLHTFSFLQSFGVNKYLFYAHSNILYFTNTQNWKTEKLSRGISEKHKVLQKHAVVILSQMLF